MDDHRTQHLVALAKQGDPAALNQLCSVYGERVRRIIRFRMGSKLRSKLDSVDVVQDALIQAMGNLENFSYKNEGDFLRWLCKIAENKFHDIYDKFHAEKRYISKEIPLKRKARQTESYSFGVTGPIETTTPSLILVHPDNVYIGLCEKRHGLTLCGKIRKVKPCLQAFSIILLE
jgi:DNA-directed RNA polymerase specialized sigma24 family protein